VSSSNVATVVVVDGSFFDEIFSVFLGDIGFFVVGSCS